MHAFPLLLATLLMSLPLAAAPRAKQVLDGHQKLLAVGEKNATAGGRKVLEAGRRMTLEQKAIIPGGCWGYADAVYRKAGFNSKQRKRIFSGQKNRAPYASVDLMKPGDWLYYLNHSYRGIEHSAIFVTWIDKTKKSALMLTYGGEGRREPARYRAYDLRNVYRIERPRE